MQEAEKIGKEKEARFVTVNTMDWEVLPFYQKLGVRNRIYEGMLRQKF